MRLPNADLARVDRGKIVNYLLSEDRPTRRGKAGYFSRFGFRSDQWEILAEALLHHGATQEVSEIERTLFGIRYAVEGNLRTPDGRDPLVRTVWQFDLGHEYPRLITAHRQRR